MLSLDFFLTYFALQKQFKLMFEVEFLKVESYRIYKNGFNFLLPQSVYRYHKRLLFTEVPTSSAGFLTITSSKRSPGASSTVALRFRLISDGLTSLFCDLTFTLGDSWEVLGYAWPCLEPRDNSELEYIPQYLLVRITGSAHQRACCEHLPAS